MLGLVHLSEHIGFNSPLLDRPVACDNDSSRIRHPNLQDTIRPVKVPFPLTLSRFSLHCLSKLKRNQISEKFPRLITLSEGLKLNIGPVCALDSSSAPSNFLSVIQAPKTVSYFNCSGPDHQVLPTTGLSPFLITVNERLKCDGVNVTRKKQKLHHMELSESREIWGKSEQSPKPFSSSLRLEPSLTAFKLSVYSKFQQPCLPLFHRCDLYPPRSSQLSFSEFVIARCWN